MGNPADWIEDRHFPLFYGGTMPESYRLDDEESALPPAPALADDGLALGYEAAQPALQRRQPRWQPELV